MTFEMPPRKTCSTSRGNVYSLVHISARASPPTLLFLHGFPSQLHDWTRQIEHFASHFYGIVAPDLLGYGQSSKPLDVSQYRLRPMSDDIVEMLDSLAVYEAVGIGHDFGATLLSRLAAYYPHSWAALVFLAVGPPKMGTPFDVAAINAMTKQALGFELLGYIPWIGEDPDAQETLEDHAESAMSLVFCANHEIWNDWYRPLGRMKQFVTEDRRVALGRWYTRELQRHHLDVFSKQHGYKGAVKWYQMWMNNLFSPDEKDVEAVEMKQPVLFICETGSSQQGEFLRAWAPSMTTVEVNSGHWMHLERALETNAAIDGFLGHLGN